MSDPLNHDSFMDVLRRTQEDERGIYIDGGLMPSGRPVRGEGVAKIQLMKDRNIANAWFEAVRGQYARETEEANNQASTPEVPDLVIQGNPAFTGNSGGDAPRHSAAGATLEEELQGRREEWGSRLARAEEELVQVQQAVTRATEELRKIDRALEAIRNVAS